MAQRDSRRGLCLATPYHSGIIRRLFPCGARHRVGWRHARPEDQPMKPEIHPEYVALEATCSCGNVIKTRSTLGKNISLDVCSECHPFYTGKQKVLDTGGRIDRFKQRFGVFGAK